MVRGHSDLGMRLRKKVALSSVHTDPSNNLEGIISRAGSESMFQSNASNRLSATSLNSPSSMTPPPTIRLPPFSSIDVNGCDDDVEQGSCLIEFSAPSGLVKTPPGLRAVIVEENETGTGNSSDNDSADSSLSVSTPLLTVPSLISVVTPGSASGGPALTPGGATSRISRKSLLREGL
ncbi:unnamed protein product [Notodromas monacha]|uniref:Uncharacterized protein n=1 Tax=Notodromas monacha TaxID=399045 RepID=A0A7R9BTX4_9CRUS|nr:unnamed protein product [Notodromas monacha]CAG0921668.1 unnamed protein product [Notodromas monacha]